MTVKKLKTWNGVPEVVANGEAYEIGLEHGRCITDRIAVSISNYQRFFHEMVQLDWQESKVIAATYLPDLQQNESDLVEEIKGVAQGAQVDFLDILAINLRNEIALTQFSDGCTAVAKTDRDSSQTYLAQNWDWKTEVKDSTAFFDIRKTGKPRIRFLGEAGMIGKFGFNDAGLGTCLNAIRSNVSDPSGLPVHFAGRRILECRSFDEALQMLEEKGVASCFNATIADRSGKMATIELTPKGLAVIYPEADAVTPTVYHTNHLWSPNIPGGIRDFPAPNSFLRLKRIKKLSAGPTVDCGRIRTWLSDEEGSPDSICRKPSPLFDGGGVGGTETLATIIFDISNNRAEISLGLPSLCPPVRVLSMDDDDSDGTK